VSIPVSTLPHRPREVTLAGMQAVIGSAIALVVLVNGMQQLYSAEVHDALTEIVASEEARSLDLTLETARSILRYTIMALAVLSVASLVLGYFVLRRHRASRVALTVVGTAVALLCLFAGPLGWLVAAYIGVSIALLWSKQARAWFRGEEQRPAAGPQGPYAPPGSPGSGAGDYYGPWPPPRPHQELPPATPSPPPAEQPPTSPGADRPPESPEAGRPPESPGAERPPESPDANRR
jgi:hypothetical protein